MTISTLSYQENCSKCGTRLSESMRHCPSCLTDAGVPNVRYCKKDENINTLRVRFEESRMRVSRKGYSKEFEDFEAMIKEKSGVVVSMPARMARNLFDDPNSIYTNYETLVGANILIPANIEEDRHRCGVGGVLFGSYAKQIVYGVLSLTEEGLPTYGDVYCRLRSVTIEDRTSFLETNSYKFISDHRIIPGGKLPVGYMACWTYRHLLVLAKLADSLSAEQTQSDWQSLLIHSDGRNRHNDDFVEAHIYGHFISNAIESLVAIPEKKLSKDDGLDINLAISKFKHLRGKTK